MRNLIGVLSLLAILCSGCGTIAGHDVFATGSCMSPVQETNMKGIYRGIRYDCQELASLKRPVGERWQYAFVPLLVFVEMPLSLGADTLVLPYDLLTLTVQE